MLIHARHPFEVVAHAPTSQRIERTTAPTDAVGAISVNFGWSAGRPGETDQQHDGKCFHGTS